MVLIQLRVAKAFRATRVGAPERVGRFAVGDSLYLCAWRPHGRAVIARKLDVDRAGRDIYLGRICEPSYDKFEVAIKTLDSCTEMAWPHHGGRLADLVQADQQPAAEQR